MVGEWLVNGWKQTSKMDGNHQTWLDTIVGRNLQEMVETTETHGILEDFCQAKILEGVITVGLISFMGKRRSKSSRDSRTCVDPSVSTKRVVQKKIG